MKKQYYFLLLLCIVCLFAASCSSGEAEQPKPSPQTQSPVDAIIEQNIEQSEKPEQSANTSYSPQAAEEEYELSKFASQITEEAETSESASQIVEEETKITETASHLENEAGRSEAAKADVDLTVLSSTMVYAEVYNIMINPESYVGKTIKGSGEYNSFYYEKMDRYFHYFVISDATGCCPQGLEFVLNGEHIYPDDYPEFGEEIEVTGVFRKGEIEGYPYYYLAVDDILVLE